MKLSEIREETRTLFKESKVNLYLVTLISAIIPYVLYFTWFMNSIYMDYIRLFVDYDNLIYNMAMSGEEFSNVSIGYFLLYPLILLISMIVQLGVSWCIIKVTRKEENPLSAFKLAFIKSPGYILYLFVIGMFVSLVTMVFLFFSMFLGTYITSFFFGNVFWTNLFAIVYIIAIYSIVFYLMINFAFYNIIYLDRNGRGYFKLFKENFRLTKGYKFTIFKLIVFYLFIGIFVYLPSITGGVIIAEAYNNYAPKVGLISIGIIIIIIDLLAIIAYNIYVTVNFYGNISLIYNKSKSEKDDALTSTEVNPPVETIE